MLLNQWVSQTDPGTEISWGGAHSTNGKEQMESLDRQERPKMLYGDVLNRAVIYQWSGCPRMKFLSQNWLAF